MKSHIPVPFVSVKALAVISLVSLAWTGALAQNDLRSLAARVDAHYNNLRTLQTDFAETVTGGGRSRTESGTLWLKRPGRMRWEYRRPQQKLFLADGKTAWFYIQGERQARKSPVRKLDDLHTPLAYLLGHTKLEKEFKALSLAPDVRPEAHGNVVLRGVPRRMGGITQVLMEITPGGQFARIQAEQEDGSITAFRFANQHENVAIPDQRFRFSPPPGVETINAEQLGM